MFGAKFWITVQVLVAYLVYTFTFTCPINENLPSNVFETTFPVTYHTCVWGHTYFRPYYEQAVEPKYNQHVKPVVQAFEGVFSKGKAVGTLVARVGNTLGRLLAKLDYKQWFSGMVKYVINWVNATSYRITSKIGDHVTPWLSYWQKYILIKVKYYWSLGLLHVQSQTHVLYIYVNHLKDKFIPYTSRITNSRVVVSVRDWISHFIETFLSKTSYPYLNEKKQFLQSEFPNLLKFDRFYPKSKHFVSEISNFLGGNEETAVDSEEDDDEGPLTVTLTSTLTVSDLIQTPEVGISVEQYNNPNVSRVNQELEIWDNKVSKTLELAASNLVIEMKPIMDEVIDNIKTNISQQFQTLQADNYKKYQLLNKMTSEVHKDFERIKQSNDTTIESYSRQDFRDVIQETYDQPEKVANSVQSILIANHEFITSEYFRIIQETIDILETFADISVQEYSKRLGNLLDELSFEDEEINWQAWKQFHKIKEYIFDFRDSIMDNANDYKLNTDTKDLKIIGLDEWNIYLRKVEFHISFLVRDNDDYLRLARAQANVALQLREGVVRDIEEMRKKQEENLLTEQKEVNGFLNEKEEIEDVIVVKEEKNEDVGKEMDDETVEVQEAQKEKEDHEFQETQKVQEAQEAQVDQKDQQVQNDQNDKVDQVVQKGQVDQEDQKAEADNEVQEAEEVEEVEEVVVEVDDEDEDDEEEIEDRKEEEI